MSDDEEATVTDEASQDERTTQDAEAEILVVAPVEEFVPWQDEQGNWVTRELIAYEQHSWEAEVSSYELATGLPAFPAPDLPAGAPPDPDADLTTIPEPPEGDPDAVPVAPVAATAEHDGFIEPGTEIPPEPQ